MGKQLRFRVSALDSFLCLAILPELNPTLDA